MAAFLKIQNPGVADPLAFTLLGASTSRSSDNSATIGKFGSGNKHGVAVCLREELPPVVFAGTLRMTFGTTDVKMDAGTHSKTFARVQVKYGGKDKAGVNRSSTEDLGYVLEYGASDWLGIDLALREFVSNAIDRAIVEGEIAFIAKFAFEYNERNPGFHALLDQKDAEAVSICHKALETYRLTAQDFKNVRVEVVEENQVRAKDGYTTVFVPLNADVLAFYQSLGKWFLHFSEPELLNKTILPKKNRNLGNRVAAVIYRRGVRVREFESSDVPSLFDYNLPNIELDEARKADDWRIRTAAGKAVRDADQDTLRVLFQSFRSSQRYWEHDFDTYGLEVSSWETDKPEAAAARQTNWQKAFEQVFDANAVIATATGGEFAERKGYNVITAPEPFVKAAGKHGVRTPEKVLTQDDREGREIIDATPDALAALDFVWDVVQRSGMTNGKERPACKVFRKIMSGGSQTLGFYRDATVYINEDIAGYGSLTGGWQVLTQQLLVTALEEVAHHVTGATDNSRDFQDYVLNLAIKLAKVQAGLI
jgi:hypothetical protein